MGERKLYIYIKKKPNKNKPVDKNYNKIITFFFLDLKRYSKYFGSVFSECPFVIFHLALSRHHTINIINVGTL